ncbi:MAG TPA: glucoamylase family protein [Candidatus Didemnitutus sp.]|nr:glucoamylase family protein [Candidatus Didemnitutus sp.]
MQALPLRWPRWITGTPRPRATDIPYRTELFTPEQLTRHARALAASHRLGLSSGSALLLTRLERNEAELRSFNRASIEVDSTRPITPAAEWLLDNFYLIEEQIQMARRHLPPAYNRELPRLVDGPSSGLPRVYDIVRELIAHVDGQVDAASLTSFVAAYQEISPLKLGELWAVPIMLRLGLIDNLQRITARLADARIARDLAGLWVGRLQLMAERNPSHLVIVIADMAEASLPLTSSFVSEFCRRLSRQSPALSLARSWLEQQLAEEGLSVEELIQRESRNQAAYQVSISHSITSLRGLGAMDWKKFVETLSAVEDVLRGDPAGVYRRMDFATRDTYRHAVEFLARHSQQSEAGVARKAIELAADSARHHGPDDRTAHVGYYLVDHGDSLLGRSLGVSWPWGARIERVMRRWPLLFYAGGIITLTAAAAVGFVRLVLPTALPEWALIAATVVFTIAVSQLAVALMNALSTLVLKPRPLPRLNYASGIAAGDRTMVVIPTLLGSEEDVERLLERIEIHFLSNRDPYLHFALLSDFRDAGSETLPGDDALLQRTREGIHRLNRRYQGSGPTVFFLFHRPRRWNTAERYWMGYERKRGKLMEFNALLRGGSRDRFSEIVGDTSILPGVRYVITLDSDTQLPRDAARQLVGTMAHRLNRPEFDPARGVVREGYGILQPRVGVSLPSAGRSWFVRLFAAGAGVDPYTRVVSDVYQDLFGEGSFIGKGIYDVDAFQRAMEGRIPENLILSHDLLEASHARSALISDVELYEEHPSRYNVDISRRHRWIRGDWQIVQWLMPRVPGALAPRMANPLSGLSQWKILDNLRRSLVPTALLVLFVGDWFLWPQLAGRGLLLALAITAVPALLSLSIEAVRKPPELPWWLHLRALAESAVRHVGQLLLTLAFLPYDAFVSLDAIGRSLLRLLVTHRGLLEWQTASDAERVAGTSLASFYGTMAIAPAVALLGGALIGWRFPGQESLAIPLLGLWFAAPWIAWRISLPIEGGEEELSEDEDRFLRRTARLTWRYFEAFVNARENWLPPDNFQEAPAPVVASRTSPTNIGLALLANLAASDLGYLSPDGLLRRTRDAFATLHRLERHRGHFYNWYDTRTLKPLPPLYVSAVDSGNLAGHLLVLAAGLRELADRCLIPDSVFRGLLDTLRQLVELGVDRPEIADLQHELTAKSTGQHGDWARLERIVAQAARLAAALPGTNEGVRHWAEVLRQTADEQRAAILRLAPWLAVPLPENSRSKTGFMARVTGKGNGPTLAELADLEESKLESDHPARGAVLEGRRQARAFREEAEALAVAAEQFAAMDFTFLYDPTRKLFATGYNVTDRRRDTGYYDLLASEARLASYVAIALGQVPQDHWFSLGRLLVGARGRPILVSWSGSMFEYLMPLLVMPQFENTLLDHTCREAVEHQVDYGRLRKVPWGISESGYNRTDIHLNYQYRAFGVPGLGLKRGLADDLVIAPYASAMAVMISPRASCENLVRLADEGRSGAYGFYEAVDYTPSRLPPGESSATVRSFMVHHQGMSLLALANVLAGWPMHRRFMACPFLKAAELLLQERVPQAVAGVVAEDLALENSRRLTEIGASVSRVVTQPNLPAPEVHLLSNGRYHVAISHAGGGYSRWRDLAVTRWREDATCDSWGMFLYLRDVAGGPVWSPTYQPVRQDLRGYEAIFSQARAEFRARWQNIDMHTEISVSPEDDVELRRTRIVNRSPSARTIEITSYAEVVLVSPADDAAHPAFASLFVQTEFLRKSSAIVCTRRPRAPGEKPPWMMHLLAVQGGGGGEVSCETDRMRFLGRGGSVARPEALERAGPLSNTTGPVLDPVVSLRRRIELAPNESAVVDFITGVAESRDGVLALIEKYLGPRMADRALDLAWTHSQVTLRHLNASEADAQLFGRLAGALLYADPARRAPAAVLRSSRRAQNALWAYGVSGDLPLVVVRVTEPERLELVRQVVQAHSYWRMKGLAVELVILNEDASAYHQALHDRIINLISSGLEAQMLDRPGGVFVRRIDQVPHDDRLLLLATARIYLDDEKGSLAEQLAARSVLEPQIPAFVASRAPWTDEPGALPPRELIFANGIGGFTRDGHEYVITLEPGRTTPQPWVNVLANPTFGTVVTESGNAYTWFENAHEFRLTPWYNDPVQDSTAEALYVRDEQSGQYWSPTPRPARGTTPHVVRHGFGYSVFEHTEFGIETELWIYVAIDAPVKFSVLKVRNRSGRSRRLSVTAACEWVLGDLRAKSLLHVQTEIDARTGALLARNHFHPEFSDRVAFLDLDEDGRTVTGDRTEFLGRNGSWDRPAAMRRARLAGRTGAGLDPCGATQFAFDLEEGGEREVCFRLGAGRGVADVQNVIQRFRRPGAARAALEQVWEYWNRTLGAINVDTPDPAVNVLANGWLVYQTLACRMWGRTGFYQSGGAFGYRDQLQDSMALVHAEPALVREHLLRAASRQFLEGDVQHWWHPPAGRGVRTHFSDDFLWLPYATCRYVDALADTGILDERVGFLAGRPVKPDEEAYYDLPGRSEATATLYDHCVRAIEHGLRFGPHGLPLIGCGDWNDGMNRIGREGRGESVWLAFFLHDVLLRFAPVARRRGDEGFAARCEDQAAQLRGRIEENAWDGEWYRRAYFDDGSPLGSRENPECQIDSLPQSWAVISGAADPVRARRAMDAVDARLVRRDAGIVLLFDPPFDQSSLDPGYIRGYIPGVRENGGQYTHGAIWTAMAFALRGDHERAWEVFRMLNPVNHGATETAATTYRVEPYVVAADVYGVPPHTGRGGWTWYTGSAGWMYRLVTETLLGVHRVGDRLRLEPRLPRDWPGCKVHYRFHQTVYHIAITRADDPAAPSRLQVDGVAVEGISFPLRDDRQEHHVEFLAGIFLREDGDSPGNAPWLHPVEPGTVAVHPSG